MEFCLVFQDKVAFCLTPAIMEKSRNPLKFNYNFCELKMLELLVCFLIYQI